MTISHTHTERQINKYGLEHKAIWLLLLDGYLLYYCVDSFSRVKQTHQGPGTSPPKRSRRDKLTSISSRRIGENTRHFRLPSVTL